MKFSGASAIVVVVALLGMVVSSMLSYIDKAYSAYLNSQYDWLVFSFAGVLLCAWLLYKLYKSIKIG